MDLAKTLIRTVVRAYYETKHVLVIDALMIHSALHNDDLALLLGMQQKDLRKLCGKLREDRLLAVHSRQETREGMQRPISKDYYYIDFHSTIDSIKYRIYRITQKVKEMYKPSEEKKDYFCPRCSARWTQLEVLDNVGPLGFLCHRCNGVLERDEESAGDKGGHEKQSRLMSQLEGMLKLLQQIDSEIIPNNDFETAFSHSIPVQRNHFVNPVRATVPVDSGRGPPTSVKGLTQTTTPQLEISLTTSSEKTAADQAAEAQRKATIAAQNVLPVWHTNSTVTGETTTIGAKEASIKRERDNNSGAAGLLKEENDEKKEGSVLNDELAAYYQQMEEEKAREAKEDESSGADGDEENDEFEDVGLDTSTPASSGTTMTNGAKLAPSTNGVLKRQGSESGSSAPVTSTATPADTAGQAEEGPSATKKVKIEEVRTGADKDSDEDEEGEFEDAL
ncbi:MAG: hypothetical protein M1830_004806 [Pleopsidium flavum]|nr:MAG: hypothetical protein M1830_004806 [Pleopsidium flavum]